MCQFARTVDINFFILFIHQLTVFSSLFFRFFFSLQDRHIKRNGDGEPFVDPSQDYILLLGYENATHTVMRFKRKLDTCDTSHDVPITVS